jgi:5-methylcytosine-specific restriction protein B
VNKEYLTWVAFYSEFAEKLLPYMEDRKTLIEKIKAVYAAIDMRLPKLEKDNNIVDIDPFTIFGLFNKGITDANRIAILKGISQEFSVKAPVPTSFNGIPVLNNQKATYYSFISDRKDDDIDTLWEVFASAVAYAKNHSESSKAALIKAYDAALLQKGIKWNLTMGLYWICPYEYINLDSRNRWYICNPENMPSDFIESVGNFSTVPSGEKYLQINDRCRSILEKGNYRYKNFPELSYYAWIVSEEVNEENRVVAAKDNQRSNVGEAIGDKNVQTTHYWIYSPGDNACMWDEFYDAEIMAIGWGEIGDLTAFATKDAMKQKMKECIDPTLSYKNAAHATWQFVNDMKPGDIVFVKKGMHRIVGRGIVTSGYLFDASRNDEYKNIRQINWTNKGEWEHPGQAVMKTLTDITSYTDYVEKLNALFEDDADEEIEEVEIQYPAYTAEDFLNEVYMSRTDYQTLISLLKNKKNIILQGAPGVGKTFAAKRLAYSMMEVKDSSRVMMVQFHQSYSYEDFIMGFRPAATGFELKKGPFYSFCKKAEMDSENDYFFIIDEINRGNLSKIFGELFMLIENDKRGVSLQLLYSDEKFSVPSNVYIIGMMNTADRSLAMLDYALRRRFAFFEFSPAFETEGFRTYRQEKSNKKFDNLIAAIEKLNVAIENDDTLGRGFRIGHSYFCTESEIDDMWLNAVITYEIVPLLNEYWFDEPSKVRDWEHVLREAIR